MTQTASNDRVADILAQTLHAHHVRHAFGVPGGEVVTVVDALQAAGIEFHLTRHETSAAVMAAGASTISGRPEVLVTTVGPGLANAVNGIADALQERIPLIILSGIVDRATRGRYTHQVIDHAQLLRPLVKATFEVEAESAASIVARALAVATSEPMGPVHLDISPAVAASRSPTTTILTPPVVTRPSVSPADPAVRDVSQILMGAERPLIIAGLESVRSGAGPSIQRVAEALGAPVVTTYKAKGIVPEDHPAVLGAAGLSPLADRELLGLVGCADLVLLIGYDPIEMRLGWLDFAAPEKLIEISQVVADHGMHHVAKRIFADTAAFTRALADALPQKPTWPAREPHVIRHALQSAFATPTHWGPHAIIDVLNDVAGDNALVTVDSGAHRILLSQKWKALRPMSLLQSAGFCTMNAALPLAIGAKVSDPGRHVIAVMGDGGLEMGIGELATVRDLGLPLTIVVFQDESLALIALKQASAGLAPAGVALGQTDFATVASAFGGYGINVETTDDLRQEIEAARGRSNFTLVACRFDASAYEGAF